MVLKGGVLENKRKMRQGSWSLFCFWREKEEELEVLVVENHRLFFDIT
jgi:hypothetical protein